MVGKPLNKSVLNSQTCTLELGLLAQELSKQPLIVNETEQKGRKTQSDRTPV